MTTILICLGTKSMMSLVRMCTVTVSIFRMCLCMCLRARERERREASTKGSDTDLVPTFNSSKDGCMEEEVELRITSGHLQLFEKSFYHFVQAHDPNSISGPYSPKRQLTERSAPLQKKFTPKHLKTRWLGWSDSVDEHHEILPNGVKSQFAEEEEPRVGSEMDEEVDRQLISSPAASPVLTHRIAWSECKPCAIESTSCIAYHHQQKGDGKQGVEVVMVEEKLKTLLDELLEADKSTYTHGASADFGDSCHCSQLPNQILATLASSCTV